jgi:hypothetical protein
MGAGDRSAIGALVERTTRFFCDPHAQWPRGSNENMNGLLRDYFPKGTDLSVHSVEDIMRIAAEVNERPRSTGSAPRARRRRERPRHGAIRTTMTESAVATFAGFPTVAVEPSEAVALSWAQ